MELFLALVVVCLGVWFFWNRSNMKETSQASKSAAPYKLEPATTADSHVRIEATAPEVKVEAVAEPVKAEAKVPAKKAKTKKPAKPKADKVAKPKAAKPKAAKKPKMTVAK